MGHQCQAKSIPKLTSDRRSFSHNADYMSINGSLMSRPQNHNVFSISYNISPWLPSASSITVLVANGKVVGRKIRGFVEGWWVRWVDAERRVFSTPWRGYIKDCVQFNTTIKTIQFILTLQFNSTRHRRQTTRCGTSAVSPNIQNILNIQAIKYIKYKSIEK